MRLVSGKKGGRIFHSQKGLSTRPVASKVREAVFQVIGTIEHARVLDLFAGTGSLGLEALSRGCTMAVFVDKSRRATRIIRENLMRVLGEGWASKTAVVTGDWARVLRGLARKGERFDVIFCDPPYGKGLAIQAGHKVLELDLLEPEGHIILFAGKREMAPECFQPATAKPGETMEAYKIFERNYGDTKVCLFQKTKR